MQIHDLLPKPGTETNIQLQALYRQFDKLLTELRKRELPESLALAVNKHIEALNSMAEADPAWQKAIRKAKASILKALEKEIKVVPKNYYRRHWMAAGMAAFGLPIGVGFSTSLGNMAFIGIGLPIGMAIGMALGTGMDKKALEEGRQLDLDIEH